MKTKNLFFLKVMLIAIILFGLFSFTFLEAQTCWAKFDPENCESNWITEVGISRRFNKPIPDSGNSGWLNVDMNLGFNKMIKKQVALGAYVFTDIGSISKYGIRPRVSYYLNNSFEANISPGLFLTTGNGEYKEFGGLSLETGISWENNLGLYSTVDFLNRHDGRNEVAVNLGMKTGGIGGPIAAGTIVVGGVVIGGIILVFLIRSISFL